MKLIEIETPDGKLLIGRPAAFPAMLQLADDRQRAHIALRTIWARAEQAAMVRRSWHRLFPGMVLSHHSDRTLGRMIETALRGGQLHAMFVRHPRRALENAAPTPDRNKVMHIELPGKTVLLAQPGRMPLQVAGESASSEKVAPMLRAISAKNPAVNAIGQQAGRVLSSQLAGGPRAALGQQLARQLEGGQIKAVLLDKPLLIQRAAVLPSAPDPISRMSAKDKIYEAMERSYALCSSDLQAALKKLREPRNLAMVIGFMLVLTGLQLIPGVDVVVDFGMLIWLLYTVGTRSVTGVKELVKAVNAAVGAKDERELNQAARHFADSFEALGEAGISALLAFLQGLRLAGRFAKAGEAEESAAAGAKKGGSSKPVPGRSLPPEVARMPKSFQQEYEAAKAAGWKKPDGSPWYPPNNGGVGEPKLTGLDKGAMLDRFGSDKGSFTSAAGEAFEKRALPGTPGALNQYEVTARGADRILVEKSEIAPWFDQPGGGTQYRLVSLDGSPMSVADAVQSGLLKKVP